MLATEVAFQFTGEGLWPSQFSMFAGFVKESCVVMALSIFRELSMESGTMM